MNKFIINQNLYQYKYHHEGKGRKNILTFNIQGVSEIEIDIAAGFCMIYLT